MTDSSIRTAGIVVTVLVHGAVFGGMWGLNALDARADRKSKLGEEEHVAIEAGLAVKSKSSAGKKSKLPQKDMAPKVKPEVEGVATNPDVVPTPEQEKKDKEKPRPEQVDPNSVFDKYRNVDTVGQNNPVGETGSDTENKAGADDGSEWGTLDKMKGDPYVGELVGRMTTNPELTVPSLVEPGQGLETWGCVKLDKSGRIVDREVPREHRSKEKTFNRAVEERLRQTTDMEKPAPDHLVGKWLCVPYRY